MVELYQLYYHPDQLKELYPFSKPHFNEKLTMFFENTPIVELVRNTKTEKICVTSWKLRQKFKYSFFIANNFTEDHLKGDYDVLSLTRNSKDHRMLRAAENWHPGFMEIMTKLWSRLGFRMPTEVRSPINHNYFSAKTEIYREYIEKLLRPAMEFMENDTELFKLCIQDSKYTALEKTANVENIKKYLGLDYYPMFPFICERLFPMWCTFKNIKVNYLI